MCANKFLVLNLAERDIFFQYKTTSFPWSTNGLSVLLWNIIAMYLHGPPIYFRVQCKDNLLITIFLAVLIRLQEGQLSKAGGSTTGRSVWVDKELDMCLRIDLLIARGIRLKTFYCRVCESKKKNGHTSRKK